MLAEISSANFGPTFGQLLREESEDAKMIMQKNNKYSGDRNCCRLLWRYPRCSNVFSRPHDNARVLCGRKNSLEVIIDQRLLKALKALMDYNTDSIIVLVDGNEVAIPLDPEFRSAERKIMDG